MSDVEQVVLYEDRASVTRRIDVPTEPGRHRLRVGPVSPLVTLQHLAMIAPVGLDVESVHVVREAIAAGDVDKEQALALATTLETATATLHDKRAHRERAKQARERAVSRVQAARAWTGRALLEDDALDAWVTGLRALEDRLHSAALQEFDADRALERADEEVTELRALLDLARGGATSMRCFLELVVRREAEGTLTVRYTIPCALWRPVHRARLGADAVNWEVGAMVWNATGEDWRDVQLVCSTARPGEHASPPNLVDDELRTRAREKEVVVEARDETIEVARPGEARQVEGVPGVDDGGEPRTFRVASQVTMLSNGRPSRVPLEAWSCPSKRAWVCTPELSPQVVLRTSQHNAGSRPLLAGPVELYRDSGAVGRGRVGFVAPGEPFEMGWGSHDGVRVRRRADTSRERARLSGRHTNKVSVSLTLSHTGKNALVVEVQERIPVSELKEVTVTTPEATPELHGTTSDGFCTWRLGLQPGETRTASLSYQVDASSNVRLPS